jgi:hypothetical protein
MTDLPEDEVAENKFPVASIEKTEPPDGVPEGEWYEYIIGQGSSAIKGKRAGSLEAVTEYVEEYADNLNRRAALGYSAYAARKPAGKPASKPASNPASNPASKPTK